MATPEFSPAENTAIINALSYWIEHWDWECPTLFGLQRAEVQAVRQRWPAVVDGKPSHSTLAVVSALRELLYGASAVGSERVHAICGIPSIQCTVLADKVLLWADQNEEQVNP